MYQKTCIFHLILHGILSSLVLLIKNRGWGIFFNEQNLLRVTKAASWRSLKEKITQTLTEIKNK